MANRLSIARFRPAKSLTAKRYDITLEEFNIYNKSLIVVLYIRLLLISFYLPDRPTYILLSPGAPGAPQIINSIASALQHRFSMISALVDAIACARIEFSIYHNIAYNPTIPNSCIVKVCRM